MGRGERKGVCGEGVRGRVCVGRGERKGVWGGVRGRGCVWEG